MSSPLISSHAEYRRSDYMFARGQSLSMRDLEWEARQSPLHSWSEFILPAVGVLAAAAVALEILC